MDQRRCSYTNISALKFFAVPQPQKKVCRSTCLEFLYSPHPFINAAGPPFYALWPCFSYMLSPGANGSDNVDVPASCPEDVWISTRRPVSRPTETETLWQSHLEEELKCALYKVGA